MFTDEFIRIKKDILIDPSVTNEEFAAYVALILNKQGNKAFVTGNILEMSLTNGELNRMNLDKYIYTLASKKDKSGNFYISITKEIKGCIVVDMTNASINEEFYVKFRPEEIYKIFQSCKNDKYSVLRTFIGVVSMFSNSNSMGEYKGKLAYPSVSTLAHSLNICERTIKKNINKLIEIKLLYKVIHKARHGINGSIQQDSNCYSRWCDKGINDVYNRCREEAINKTIVQDKNKANISYPTAENEIKILNVENIF